MFVVTTSYDPSSKEWKKAESLAQKLKVPYVQRDQMSLEKMMQYRNVDGVLIVTKRGLRYESSDRPSFFFSP